MDKDNRVNPPFYRNKELYKAWENRCSMSALSNIGNFTLFQTKDTDLFVFKTVSGELQQKRREGRIELVVSEQSYNILDENYWITLNYQ